MKTLLALLLPIFLFGVDQSLDINIKSSTQIRFQNIAMTNSDFEAIESGLLQAVIQSRWKYSNSEKNRGQDYKVTGQITSHSKATAPTGWSIQSILEPPRSDSLLGNSSNNGEYITLPWADETPVNFIVNLPQAKAGVGEQFLKVVVDSAKHFTASQDFVIAWTILPE